ncbi:hypothetical protein DL96DRAFT_1720582 [Flagelloscypha sp. PMI_526]|nr:hypothetical protein DL96DRAFT_1720582 [Flagelloscypha sp. PMI_526]
MLFILNHSTLYPLPHELAIRPHLQPEDLEHYSESLLQRSKIVMNGLVAIIAFAASTISTTKRPSETIVPFIMLLWCILNRLCYENLPADELQKRVKLVFIAYQVANFGGWIGIIVLIGSVLVRASLYCVPWFKINRHQDETLGWWTIIHI